MIRIHSNGSQVSEYKRLLASDWNQDFPAEVLSLLWSSVRAETIDRDAPLGDLLDPSSSRAFPVEYFRSLLRRLAGATGFIPWQELPKLPLDYQPSRRLSRSAWLAARLATYLTLRAHTKVSGNVEFFGDVQALAFHAALSFVLPALKDKNPAEHAVLLHALVVFPLEYYASDPAHFCYLLSLLHGYLGNIDQRLRFLHASFRFTPPNEHSFLTKAQELWMELLDCERYRDAETFLLSLSRCCLPAQQDEVNEMIVDALKFMLVQQEKA